jgi:hypothetical protein
MAFCSKCGKELNDGAAFCEGCGNALGGEHTKNQQPAQEVNRHKKLTYSLPALANGILAVVLGGVGQAYVANTTVYGPVRYLDKKYDAECRAFNAAGDRLSLLLLFGAILIVFGVVMLFIKPKKSSVFLSKILLIAPMVISIAFAIINYVTIFGFKS